MREKIITTVIIVMSVLAPLLIIPSQYVDGKYNIPKLIVLLATGAILLILVLANYKKLYIDKTDILLLIFGGLVLLSTLFSSEIKRSILGGENRYEGMLAFFTYILIFFSTKKFFKKEYLKKYTIAVYIVVIAICILSISQYYIKKIDLPPIFKKNNYGGSSGTFGNSNFLGSFVSIFLPISISIYLIKGKIRYLCSSILLFATMQVCIARSSWVAFFITSIIIIMYLLYKRKKEYFIRFLLIVITFVCAFQIITNTGRKIVKTKSNKMVNEIREITQIEDINEIATNNAMNKLGSGRIGIWKMVIKLTLRHPILGVGPDNLVKGQYNDKEIRYNEMYYFYKNGGFVDKAHNEYLQIAVTIGIPALIIYLTFLVIICFKNLKLSLKNNARFILLLSIISYLVQAFFNISTIGIAPLFWVMLGLISNENVIEEINKKSGGENVFNSRFRKSRA